MNQPFVRCGIGFTITVCLTVSSWAASKPKVSTESVEAVQELLESEPLTANESVDRRDVLKPETRPETDSDSVWWQAGYTKSGKQWVGYEESIASGADQKLLEEYQDQRSKLSNQPHGEWQLANWCRRNGLADQEYVHLLNVLAIRDTMANRAKVLERLGFRRIENQWVSPKEQQEIAKQNFEIERSHKRWDAKFETLIKQLNGTPKQRIAAEKQLAEISHPSAVPTIVSTLCISSQPLAEQGVKVLDQIPEYEASRALAGQAVFSPWKPVRKQAVENLKKRKLEEYVPDLLLLLSGPIRVQLQDEILFRIKHQEEFGSPSSLETTALGTKDFSYLWTHLDYVLVEETRDTIRVGIRRLFPVTAPSNVVTVFSFFTPQVRGSYHGLTGQRTSPFDALMTAAELTGQIELLDFNADRMNDFRIELNERVGTVLAECTNQPASSDPNVWWDWWTNYSSVASPSQKNVVIADERQSQPNTFSMTLVQASCLVASTPVWTERGSAPIESIRPGDRVLSKDVITGELCYKPVLMTTVRKPTRISRFCVGNETIQASLGHHFWVSGDGWNKTKALNLGAPLHTAAGMQRISSIDDEGKSEKVYNFVVADFHTYFVGKSMILSHDVTTPSLTNVKIPGLSTK